jgi:hypothetical protein
MIIHPISENPLDSLQHSQWSLGCCLSFILVDAFLSFNLNFVFIRLHRVISLKFLAQNQFFFENARKNFFFDQVILDVLFLALL